MTVKQQPDEKPNGIDIKLETKLNLMILRIRSQEKPGHFDSKINQNKNLMVSTVNQKRKIKVVFLTVKQKPVEQFRGIVSELETNEIPHAIESVAKNTKEAGVFTV